MGQIFKFQLFTFVIASAFSLLAAADVVPPSEYPFPLKNPLFATMASLLNHPQIAPDVIALEYRKDRANVATLVGRNKIDVGLFAQKKPAPLIFVVSGLGGDGTSGSTEFLAEEYNAMGFHAVTVPNPFSWQYVLGASETTLPGFIPRDTHEYYQFLKFVVSELKKQKQIKVTGFAVSGYSMGGLVTAFLMSEDNVQHQFNFQKALIINPAYDMNFGINRLDQLYRKGDVYTDQQKWHLMGKLQDTAVKISQSPNPIAGLVALSDAGTFNDRQLSWVIGDSFRQSLAEVILTSQQIKDLGILKTPMNDYNKDGRTAEARQFSFVDYMRTFVAPSVRDSEKSNLDEFALMKMGSLYSLDDMLKNDNRIYVFDNADDLIVNADHIENLKTVLGDRLYLYPNGGHVGNLWFERNRKDLVKALSAK